MLPEQSPLERIHSYLDRVLPALSALEWNSVAQSAQTITSNLSSYGVPMRTGAILQKMNRVTMLARRGLANQSRPDRDLAPLIEEFSNAALEAVYRLERYQQAVVANTGLSLAESRRLVLTALFSMDAHDDVWLGDLMYYAGLTQNQVIDAIEYWMDQAAIQSPDDLKGRRDQVIAARVSLTHRGRDTAEGASNAASPLGLTAVSQQNNYNINATNIVVSGVLGTAYGPVHATTSVSGSITSDAQGLSTALQDRAANGDPEDRQTFEDLAESAREIAAEPQNKSRIKRLLRTITSGLKTVGTWAGKEAVEEYIKSLVENADALVG